MRHVNGHAAGNIGEGIEQRLDVLAARPLGPIIRQRIHIGARLDLQFHQQAGSAREAFDEALPLVGGGNAWINHGHDRKNKDSRPDDKPVFSRARAFPRSSPPGQTTSSRLSGAGFERPQQQRVCMAPRQHGINLLSRRFGEAQNELVRRQNQNAIGLRHSRWRRWSMQASWAAGRPHWPKNSFNSAGV